MHGKRMENCRWRLSLQSNGETWQYSTSVCFPLVVPFRNHLMFSRSVDSQIELEPIISLAVIFDSSLAEIKTRFLLLWSVPSKQMRLFFKPSRVSGSSSLFLQSVAWIHSRCSQTCARRRNRTNGVWFFFFFSVGVKEEKKNAFSAF